MSTIIDEITSYFKQYTLPNGGVNASVKCPFHQDNGQHLSINISSGLWQCWVCHNRGTWKNLSQRLGLSENVILKTPDSNSVNRFSINENKIVLAEGFLKPMLNKPLPSLLSVGFTDEILQQHEIGFDSNNNRIVFPIRDLDGDLVGISGRATQNVNPKYLFYTNEFKTIYPEYVFEKSRYLYHGNHVKNFKPSPSYVIVTEGFKACLWMVQCGYENTIAIMGSSLSAQQAFLLSKLCDTFVIFLDSDSAGTDGLKEAYKKLKIYGKVFTVNAYKKQPDDYSKEEIDQLLGNKVYYVTR
jgi:DNA primase